MSGDRCASISSDGHKCAGKVGHGTTGILHQWSEPDPDGGWGTIVHFWSDKDVTLTETKPYVGPPRGTVGNRIVVYTEYRNGKPSGYVVRNQFGDSDLEEHFRSLKKAEARAEELNLAEVLAERKLDPLYDARRERFVALGDSFASSYGEGHPAMSWPDAVGRYAVKEYSDRYSESFWSHAEDLDEVRERITGGAVEDVVDLDTGRKVSFTVSVEIDGALAPQDKEAADA